MSVYKGKKSARNRKFNPLLAFPGWGLSKILMGCPSTSSSMILWADHSSRHTSVIPEQFQERHWQTYLLSPPPLLFFFLPVLFVLVFILRTFPVLLLGLCLVYKLHRRRRVTLVLLCSVLNTNFKSKKRLGEVWERGYLPVPLNWYTHDIAPPPASSWTNSLNRR